MKNRFHERLSFVEVGRREAGNDKMYAEETMHGQLHRLKFRIQEVINEKRIEYTRAFRLPRLWFPKNTFRIEEIDDGSRFTTTVRLRVGRMAKRFAKNRIKEGLAAVKRHMQGEGENREKMLEQP